MLPHSSIITIPFDYIVLLWTAGLLLLIKSWKEHVKGNWTIKVKKSKRIVMLKNGRFLIIITQIGWLSTITDNFIPIAQISLRCCLQHLALLLMYFLSVIAVHITLVILYIQRPSYHHNNSMRKYLFAYTCMHDSCQFILYMYML